MKRSVVGLLLCPMLAGVIHAQSSVSGNVTHPDEREAAIRHAMDPANRVDEYKSRIDFDRKFATDDGRMVVAFEWSRLAGGDIPGFTALKIDSHVQRINETGPLKGIRMDIFNGHYDGAPVSITVAQAGDRFRAADYFINETTATSTAQVLFETNPDPLGTVSVQSVVAGPGRGLVWIYKNLCFVVTGAPEGAVRDLSFRLQAMAEAHTVNSK
jgi:hypothetical protein